MSSQTSAIVPRLPDDAWHTILANIPLSVTQFHALRSVSSQLHTVLSTQLHRVSYLHTHTLFTDTDSCAVSVSVADVVAMLRLFRSLRTLFVTNSSTASDDLLYKTTLNNGPITLACGTSLTDVVCRHLSPKFTPCLKRVVFTVKTTAEQVRALMENCPTVTWLSFMKGSAIDDGVCDVILDCVSNNKRDVGMSKQMPVKKRRRSKNQILSRLDIAQSEEISERSACELLNSCRISSLFFEQLWTPERLTVGPAQEHTDSPTAELLLNSSPLSSDLMPNTQLHSHSGTINRPGPSHKHVSLSNMSSMHTFEYNGKARTMVVQQCDSIHTLSLTVSKLETLTIQACSQLEYLSFSSCNQLSSLQTINLRYLPNTPPCVFDTLFARCNQSFVRHVDLSYTQVERVLLSEWPQLRSLIVDGCDLLSHIGVKQCPRLRYVGMDDLGALETACVVLPSACQFSDLEQTAGWTVNQTSVETCLRFQTHVPPGFN